MESLDQKNYNNKDYNLTSWLVAIFIIKIIIILIAYPSINHNHYIYETYIKIAEQSLVPYKDFYFEYPPLFSLIIALPFNLIKFKNIAEYQIYFQIFILIFDLMAMQISLKIFAKLNNNKLEPNKQKKFYFSYPFSIISNLELEIKDGINPNRTIYLILKDTRRIPLNPKTKLEDIYNIELKAIELAKILNIDLKFNDKTY